MRITVSDGQAEHILSDGLHGGLRLTPASETQVRRFLRAENATPTDRGNALLHIQFEVTSEHADISAASQYSLERYSDVPREGLVKFERKTGEVVDFQRYFQTGVVTLVDIIPKGSRTVEVWNITGGKLLLEEELT
jgi:hypothetical protein